MNYYNPYFTMIPTATAPASSGILGGALKGGINFSSILSGTQKVLGIANQAIPLVKQVSPVVKNAKTMFRLMNEFKKVDAPNPGTATKPEAQVTPEASTSNNQSDHGPTFFL